MTPKIHFPLLLALMHFGKPLINFPAMGLRLAGNILRIMFVPIFIIEPNPPLAAFLAMLAMDEKNPPLLRLVLTFFFLLPLFLRLLPHPSPSSRAS